MSAGFRYDDTNYLIHAYENFGAMDWHNELGVSGELAEELARRGFAEATERGYFNKKEKALAGVIDRLMELKQTLQGKVYPDELVANSANEFWRLIDEHGLNPDSIPNARA